MGTRASRSRPIAMTAQAQLTTFIARYTPEVGRLAKAALKKMRARLPGAVELVYDNYNALAIGYSSTERTSDVLFSLAVYARGVNLYFMYGRSLPDPHKLLQGSGSQGAFVRLDDVSVLDEPRVKALIAAAVKQAQPLPVRGGYTIVKSISAKQRPRRV